MHHAGVELGVDVPAVLVAIEVLLHLAHGWGACSLDSRWMRVLVADAQVLHHCQNGSWAS